MRSGFCFAQHIWIQTVCLGRRGHWDWTPGKNLAGRAPTFAAGSGVGGAPPECGRSGAGGVGRSAAGSGTPAGTGGRTGPGAPGCLRARAAVNGVSGGKGRGWVAYGKGKAYFLKKKVRVLFIIFKISNFIYVY